MAPRSIVAGPARFGLAVQPFADGTPPCLNVLGKVPAALVVVLALQNQRQRPALKRPHPVRIVVYVDVNGAITAGRSRHVSAKAVDLLAGMADQLLKRVFALPMGSGTRTLPVVRIEALG